MKEERRGGGGREFGKKFGSWLSKSSVLLRNYLGKKRKKRKKREEVWDMRTSLWFI